MERRADGKTPLDADDPRRLRVVPLLVVDGPVEPCGNVVHAAPGGAREGDAEELAAGRIGEENRCDGCGGTVEVPQGLGPAEDDRHAQDEGQVPVKAHVCTDEEGRFRGGVGGDVLAGRDEAAGGQARLVQLRLAPDFGVLPGLGEAHEQVQVERIALVEGVGDRRDLRRLAHEMRFARADRFVGAYGSRDAQQQEHAQDAQPTSHAPLRDANGGA